MPEQPKNRLRNPLLYGGLSFVFSVLLVCTLGGKEHDIQDALMIAGVTTSGTLLGVCKDFLEETDGE
ncbi:MAG: hypothetical protein ACRCXZ_00105 [Patescibacteria group bacterium]